VKKKITIVALAVALGGCGNMQMTREEMLGTAGGAVLGGVIGYQFGGGTLIPALLATAGTVVGGTTGYMTVRALSGTDRAAYENTTQMGLNSAGDGQVIEWRNPETGSSGIFRATTTYRSPNGQYCRKYRSTVAFERGVKSGDGIACQQADGTWKVVTDDFS
jgi:surface antigen